MKIKDLIPGQIASIKRQGSTLGGVKRDSSSEKEGITLVRAMKSVVPVKIHDGEYGIGWKSIALTGFPLVFDETYFNSYLQLLTSSYINSQEYFINSCINLIQEQYPNLISTDSAYGLYPYTSPGDIFRRILMPNFGKMVYISAMDIDSHSINTPENRIFMQDKIIEQYSKMVRAMKEAKANETYMSSTNYFKRECNYVFSAFPAVIKAFANPMSGIVLIPNVDDILETIAKSFIWRNASRSEMDFIVSSSNNSHRLSELYFNGGWQHPLFKDVGFYSRVRACLDKSHSTGMFEFF